MRTVWNFLDFSYVGDIYSLDILASASNATVQPRR